MALQDIIKERQRKLNQLRQKGIDPYPAKAKRTHLIFEVREKFDQLEEKNKEVFIAGRVISKREHGGSTFIDLQDGSAKMQALFRKNILNDQYNLFLETVDIGDFIEISGRLFRTKRGEKTIEAQNWQMLAKSIRPLPEKWHKLKDVEERFRKRYLDLIINEEVKKRFLIRSRIITAIRKFLDKNSFVEVETPMLHPIPGGALAKPFITHHNALDQDLYLRIAPELYLKRLLVGGFDKIYELGRCFRNEGIDSFHNPEFTMLEFYAAYWDEEMLMDFVEKMFVYLAEKVLNSDSFVFNSNKITISPPFPKIPFKKLLSKYVDIKDYEQMTNSEMKQITQKLGLEVDRNESKGKMADEIYKKICRPKLIQPTFVTNHPVEISPLAKAYTDNPSEARRFQLVVGGAELTNCFAELNDPQQQRQRFIEQEKERRQGEEEAHPIDEEFVEALEYGMPPAAGFGMGIDRLTMLLTNTQNIKEVILFPTLRKKQY